MAGVMKLAAALSAGVLLTASALPAADSPFSTAQLAERALERRAVEAVIWGMPAVNFDLMYQAAVQAKGSWNQVVYWSRLPDWKIQTLTPNPDAIYLTPFTNTAEVGPVVLEIPPADEGSITGTVMDVWQCALEDVGPAGVDKGQGGKYLILPPAYKDQLPAGYIPMPSDTYQGYALLRSIPKSGSDADVARAVAYGKRIKLYPLSQASAPYTGARSKPSSGACRPSTATSCFKRWCAPKVPSTRSRTGRGFRTGRSRP